MLTRLDRTASLAPDLCAYIDIYDPLGKCYIPAVSVLVIIGGF